MMELVTIMDAESFEVLFVDAGLLDLSVMNEKKYTQFQVEDGSSRSDHSIQLPIKISLKVHISGDTKETFDAVQRAYEEYKLLIVQTRVRTYKPMVIETMPHTEQADDLDGVMLDISLIEWRTVTPVYGDAPARTTKKPKQASTVKRGQQQTTPAPDAGAAPKKKGSILSGIFN